jgi:hypothetical protein
MLDWRELERVVAAMHTKVDQNAVVEHDVRLKGKSGHRYQVDVLIRRQVGMYETRIVVECKRHARPVGVAAVGSFRTTLEDLGAMRGVLVSASGFSKPAIALADRYSITLLSYRQASDADWHELTSPESQLYFIIDSITFDHFEIATEPDEDRPLAPDEEIVDASGTVLATVKAFQKMVWQILSDEHFLGSFRRDITIPAGLQLRKGAAITPIQRVRCSGFKKAHLYVLTPRVSSGHVLRGSADRPLFQEVHFEDIPWERMAEMGHGIELTLDQYLKNKGKSPKLPFTPVMRDVDGQLRVTLTKLVPENLPVD